MPDKVEIKAIVVDDEQSSRTTLGKMLEEFCPSVEVAGFAGSVKEAVAIIKSVKPQIVFLDIEMPVESGFELFGYFDQIDFSVIFTTAYDQYAVRAFKYSAIDYILKPIDIEELQAGVKKAIKRNKFNSTVDGNQRFEVLKENMREEGIQRIALPTSTGFRFLRSEMILRCQADGNYSTFYLKDNSKFLITKPIKDVEDLLRDVGFYRINRSHIVNLQYIVNYKRQKHHSVVLEDGTELRVSDQKKIAIQEQLRLL